MRFKFILLAAALSLLTATAYAANEAACFNRDLDRIDHYVTPPEGGDNAFFTAISNLSSQTNVSLVVDAKRSMNRFTERMYDVRQDGKSNGYSPDGGIALDGCNFDDLNNLTYFMPTTATSPTGDAANYWTPAGTYDSAKTYQDPGSNAKNVGYYGGSTSQAFTDKLTTSKAYYFGQWPSGSSDTTNNAQDYTTACNNFASTYGGNATVCNYCLNHKGYYLNPSEPSVKESAGEGVFTTNWLRFHPVKWVLLTLAYKRLVQGPLLSNLRESVVVTDNQTADGGYVTQKMLPESCQGAANNGNGNSTPPLQSKISVIDSVNYNGSYDPLAETLFNVAWYMSGGATSSSYWIYSSDSTTKAPSGMNVGKSEPCSHCAGAPDFLVLFSDGRSDAANPNCVPAADGDVPAFCTQKAVYCSTAGLGGAVDGGMGDGDQFLNSVVKNTAPPADLCNNDYAANVAGWMHNPDGGSISSYNSNEKLTTYVVALGDVSSRRHGELNVLDEIASASGTTMVVANDFSSLESAISNVFETILSTATSFSSASITTVQSQGYTSAFIPRFSPQTGAQWTGTLERLNFFNEFSAGCTSADYGKTDSGVNPNGDSSCYDVYLTDKDSSFVSEVDGQFVKLDAGAPWDTTANGPAGWPPLTAADGGYVAATPFWEASAVLTARVNAVLAGDAGAERLIYTVAPKSDNSGNYNPTLISFDTSNVSTLTPLLRLGRYYGDLCNTIANLTRHSYTSDDDCAKDVINFIRGKDVMLQNSYNRTVANPDGGADLAGTPSPMHARPNILGDIFHSSPILVTPPIPTYLCDLGVVNQCTSSLYDSTLEAQDTIADGGQAYNAYVSDESVRDDYIVVGANDGMIHAFQSGSATDVTGTGQELWAFIPPDMLPKLVWYMAGTSHSLLMDGTPMVRDIWYDSNGDHKKQESEYHTVGIFGDREGGRHYTALDLTNPAQPTFLWSWPKAGSTEALSVGQSWDDLGPSPPPIGPIAEADSSSTTKINGVNAKERYVVAIGGGYDPAFIRGRGIIFLDAYTGAEVYRFSPYDGQTNSDKLFPVAAPVSMIDTNSDGIFDTAVVGDTGGQVWTVNMYSPGSPAGGPYTNWSAGRAFVQFKSSNFSQRSPFFQRAVASKDSNGDIRIYLGSGDRAQIKDPDGGTCGLANLDACMRKGCSVSVNEATQATGSQTSTGTFAYTGGSTAPTFTHAADTVTDGVACSDTTNARVYWSINCGAGDAGTWDAGVSCDWGSTDAGVQCATADSRPSDTAIPSASTVVDSRFYAIKLFDSANRVQQPFDATTYDTNALTDSDLVDVTTGTTLTSGTSNGWYVQHQNSIDERTSSSALLLSGCVVWNTLQPNPDTTLSCDDTIPLDTAYRYQADVDTGAIACGNGTSASATVRFTSRTTYVAPQAPAPVVSVNKNTGQVAYGSVSLDPGSPPSAVTVGTNDIVAPIHWLEVPRKVHDCRHGTDATKCE